MRRILSLVAVAILAIAIFAAFTVVRSTADAGENFHDSSRGASASWFVEDGGGGFTSVFVMARDFRVQMPPGPGFSGSEVFVEIFRGDPATGMFSEGFGMAALTPNQFQVDRKLSEASLSATVEVCEFIFEPPPDGEPPGEPPNGKTLDGEPPNGEPPPEPTCFDLNVELVWAGIGSLSHSHGNFHFRSDGMIDHQRFRDSFREAELTGTVNGDTISLTGDTAEFADIHSSRFGGLFIGEPFFP